MAYTSVLGSGVFGSFVFARDSVTVDLTSSHLILSQTVVEQTVYNRSLTQTLTFGQVALNTIFLSVTNTLTFTQTAVNVIFLTVTNTLTLSQSATQLRIVPRSVSNVLSLNFDVQSVNWLIRSVSNTLTFQHLFFRPTNISGQFQLLPIPEVILTKVYNRVSFRTKNRAIVLSPPDLGDTENNTGKIVLQRTITGATYVYARRTNSRRLKYVFEMDTNKRLEMRRFMLDCLSEPIWLENWKGELWVGYFINNPFEETSKGSASPVGDRYTFDVEFEGERVH